MIKSQIPITNHQANPDDPNSNVQNSENVLVFGTWKLFGIWCLVFGACLTVAFPQRAFAMLSVDDDFHIRQAIQKDIRKNVLVNQVYQIPNDKGQDVLLRFDRLEPDIREVEECDGPDLCSKFQMATGQFSNGQGENVTVEFYMLWRGPAGNDPEREENFWTIERRSVKKSPADSSPVVASPLRLAPSQIPKPGESREKPAPSPRKIEKVYNLDGGIFSETDLFSDRYNGFYRTFHPNGNLATEVRYKNGFLIYNEAFNDQGKPVDREGIVRTKYANGNLFELTEYKNDRKNGRERIYYYDGRTLVAERQYLNDRKVGIHKIYDNSGKFLEDEDWGYPTKYVEGLVRDQRLLGVICLGLIVAIALLLRKKF